MCMGLERWLTCEDQLLFFQRIQVQILVPTSDGSQMPVTPAAVTHTHHSTLSLTHTHTKEGRRKEGEKKLVGSGVSVSMLAQQYGYPEHYSTHSWLRFQGVSSSVPSSPRWCH